MDVSQEKLAGAKRMIIVLNPCNVVYTMETSMVNAMALYLDSSRDRVQNAIFLQRSRNLTHFVPPKSRPPPFSFR